MSTVTTKTDYTPEDLLTMPDGDRYELVDGQLVERNMSYWSSYVAGEIFGLLREFCRSQPVGWVTPEGTTYQWFPDAPNKVRKPDVSFISLKRLALPEATEEGHRPLPPDLAIEVLSPNDLASDIARKVDEYLKAGVRLVWVVIPETCSVVVYRADGSVSMYRAQDEITGEDVLPGFRCAVALFFRPPTGSTAIASPAS